jgi:Zn-dependent protease
MTQPPFPQTFPFQPSPRLACPDCGTELSPALLSCPRCHRLVHRDRLNQLAGQAQAAVDSGDANTALALWREALGLLPSESKQYAAVAARVDALSKQADGFALAGLRRPPPPHGSAGSRLGKTFGAGAAVALLLWKFKFVAVFLLTKGKLLLLGLTNFSTLFSMALSIGVYWIAFGWKFALGLVLSIYVHEMGHVAMLLRYGMKASAPMFIPGLGALIMLRQHPQNPREDARIGLAGPIWGLGAAAVCWGVSLLTGWPSWAAIAKVGAWLNLFNLLPVWQLDGGRAFRALSNRQRWVTVVTLGLMFVVAREGLLAIIAVVAGFRAVKERRDAPPEGDSGAFYQFVFLIVALALMSEIRVPGIAVHH